MQTIHKQIIQIKDEQTLILPASKILHYGCQGENLCVWYETDSDLLDIYEYTVQLCIYGTGNPIKQDFDYCYNYLATVQVGEFVWHLYSKYA